MPKADTYSSKGTKQEGVNLPKALFGEKQNDKLLAQAIHVYRDRQHLGNSKVKTRGEVTATTRKWYRQKGTGRARHGAVSAPLFVGGGVAHGPKGVKKQLSLPKKMRQKALALALSAKAKDGKVVVITGLEILTKTKEAQKLLTKVGKGAKKFTFAFADKSAGAVKAFRNISNVNIVFFSDLNAHSVYFGGTILVDKEALK